MTFRYDDAILSGRDFAMASTVNFKDDDERKKAIKFIDNLMKEYGPVVSRYPNWHPFEKVNDMVTNRLYFYDHPLFLRDAVLFAPYKESEMQVREFFGQDGFFVEKVDGPYHNKNCHLYLVSLIDDMKNGERKRYLDRRLVIQALLGNWKPTEDASVLEYACWESWETMHRYLLGVPCGKRSSVFVDEETGQAIKRLYAVIGQALGLKEYGRV